MTAPRSIAIASRESSLAMVQSEWVAARLRGFHAGVEVRILGMTTRGDQILDKPLAQIGGKGLFIKELEVALEEGRADIAVHSNRFESVADLPVGATVGTSSLRRESQLRHARPDLKIEALRGNVNTRLAKLDAGQYDAIILAAAGLKRLGFHGRIRSTLDPAQFLPAIAQGALGIEIRAARSDVAKWLAPFEHAGTTATVAAERAMGRALTASCDVPLGGRATVSNGLLRLEGFVAMPDGSRMLRDSIEGPPASAESMGLALAQRLLDAGAADILAQLARHA
jgi:hydroxymethylbilane synthase